MLDFFGKRFLLSRSIRDHFYWHLVWLTAITSMWLWQHCRQEVLQRTPAGLEDSDEQARRYAADLLARSRAELNRVDTKASILLAGAGTALGAVAGSLLADGWSPFRLSIGPAIFWWVGVVAGVIGSLALLAAVYPNHRPGRAPIARRTRYLGYYIDVVRYRSPDELAATIRESAARELEVSAEQLLQVSLIVHRKYSLVRGAMWMLAAGMGCTIYVAIYIAA